MVFLGTAEFAVPALEAVARAAEVLAVVTRPDRPRGRGLASGPSAVAAAAERLALTTLKPEEPNAEAVRGALASLRPDLFAVVAFGAILSPALLAVPRLGAVNLHGSLLPEYRGAAPVQRALWDGRAFSGVTTLWMDEGIDTGDLILQRWHAIAAEDDAGSLARSLAVLGGPLLAESLTLASAGRAERRPQERDAGSYARKLRKEDGVMDWTLDAASVWSRQRAVTPWPGATTAFRDRRLQVIASRPLHLLPLDAAPGSVIEVLRDGVAVACGRGALLLRRVKPEGRSEMEAADWARGVRLERDQAFAPVKEAMA